MAELDYMTNKRRYITTNQVLNQRHRLEKSYKQYDVVIPSRQTPAQYIQDTSTPLTLQRDVDIDILRGWHKECQRHHGNCCNDRYSDALAHHIDRLILVDVETACLVELPACTPYIALSYVWGQVDMPKLRQPNFEELKQPGVLRSPIDGIELPKTIRDAMHLVSRLGERYLWVDCFSVKQDASVEEMSRTLKAMARIYASAELTIVAAGGTNADYGLPGVGGPAESRSLSLLSFFSPRNPTNRYGYPWASRWASRGWTFQESLFSRRLLIFEGAVSWMCGRCTWLEDYPDIFERPDSWPVERPHLGVPMGMLSLIPEFPTLGRWGMLVENFSVRSLSYLSDYERAFAGATEIMGSTYPGGLLHGLPIFFFDIAILWQPKSSALNRRPEEPSWSWTGWTGRIECLEHWCPYYPGVYRKSGESSDWVAPGTLKCVAVYRPGPSSQNADFQEMNKFYEYQAYRSEPHARLPDGWKREHHPDGDYYTHVSKQDDSFRYSFPLPAAVSLQTVVSSPILLCTAPVIKLSFGEQESIGLSVYSGEMRVGIVATHKWYTHAERAKLSCDLVAISEAEVLDEDNDAGLKTGEGSGEDRVSFYNVLWIEWEEDIAYRNGVGQVNKAAWDALDAKVVTFKLG